MSYKNKGYILTFIISFLFIVSLSISIIGAFYENTYTITVTDTYVKNTKNDSIYIVQTTLDNDEIRVFKNDDSLARLKFNSSDMQAKIKVGKKYEIITIGFRIPLFSMYENIIELEEIK